VAYELVPAAREVTLYDLLRHTSGLTYANSTSNAAVKEAYVKLGLYQASGAPDTYRDLTPAQEVEQLAKAPLAFQPGRAWEYGLSTDLLGRVLEVVSGKRLGELLEARVFKPLQMHDTGFFVPKDRAARLAQGFATNALGQPSNFIDVLVPPKNDSGGFGAVSTVPDYFRFCEMLLRGGELGGVRLLSRSSVILMTSDHLGQAVQADPAPAEALFGTKGYTYGLGLAVRREDGLAPVAGRAGEITWAGGAGTYFWIDPQEELIAIVMFQAAGTRGYQFKLFRQLVYAAIAD